MGVFEVIGTIFLVFGCVFSLTGSVGVLRMPDFYSRLHPAGKTDAFAQLLILTGLAFFSGQKLFELLRDPDAQGMAMVGEANIMLKLMLISALILVTAPTATHAIAKAARLDRFTRIRVEDDAGASRIEDIVVVGDVREQLHEQEGPLLDVREDDVEDEHGEHKPDTQSSEDD